MSDRMHDDRLGLQVALKEARTSYEEGGIPIGSSLVHHSSPGVILGAGHNKRVQKASPILHAELAAFLDAGRLNFNIYKNCTMYTTLSPCSMCAGAILLYKIPRVVIGENTNFCGEEELLRLKGVEVIVLDDPECKELMEKFINEKPKDWYEDIGEPYPESIVQSKL